MRQQLKLFLKKLLDLREGAEEKHVIVENIKDEADVSSARFWTLVFAIGVASVGLNINSTPVIIGAMLISPIMGPVVSIGLALSINDWGLMRRSLRNLAILTLIGFVISTIYFALTPITNAQSELLSRTQPTIFDVLIAIFGGMAGFIGLSRAKFNNIIPGVAIATALIPPLCTVGYGIATLQPAFIFGAFYLFLINCIFICLSALVVATYMKLPKKEYASEAKKKQVNFIITGITIVMIIPAVYLAYTFVQQNNFNQSAENFVQTTFEEKGYVVIYKNLQYSSDEKKIELAFLSKRFTDAQLQQFEADLTLFGLEDTDLQIRQDSFELSEEEWRGVLEDIQNKDDKAAALQARIERERISFQSPTRLLEELKTINSKVTNIAIGSLTYGEFESNEAFENSTIAIIYSNPDTEALVSNEAVTIENWLKTRLENGSLLLHFIPSIQAGVESTNIGR